MSSINDKSDWKTVQKAFVVIDFAPRDIEVGTLGGGREGRRVLYLFKTTLSPLVTRASYAGSDRVLCLHSQNLLGIIASVLHLGNIQFEEDNNGHAIITNGTQLHWISKVPAGRVSDSELIWRRPAQGPKHMVSHPGHWHIEQSLYGQTFRPVEIQLQFHALLPYTPV